MPARFAQKASDHETQPAAVNILFANYGDFATNSLNHIGPFANRLVEMGHPCLVAVPRGRETVACLDEALFQPATFADVLGAPNHFPNGQPADILHAWTPRESVRQFCESYARRHPCKVVVHLEDNEETVAASYYRQPFERLAEGGLPTGFSAWQPALVHPRRYRAFLALADATTAVIRSLFAFSAADRPRLELLPGLPPEAFQSEPLDEAERAAIGLAPEEQAIVYPGGVTSANREDVRQLYVALRLLRREGWPVKLVKTGPGDPELNRGFGFDLGESVIDLGVRPRPEIFRLLASAVLLAQPGSPGAFNDCRLPSKLPEFLAAGRPVVAPQTNFALKLEPGVHYLPLKEGSPEEIAARAAELLSCPERAAKIGAMARERAAKSFSLEENAEGLLSFYDLVLSGDSSNWKPFLGSGAPFSENARQRLEDLQRELPRGDWRQGFIDALGAYPEAPDAAPPAPSAKEEDAGEEGALAEAFNRIHILDQKLAEAERRQKTLEKRNSALEAEAARLRDKASRMQASASWRLGAPLRAFRRQFIDPWKRPSPAAGEALEEVPNPQPKASPAEPPRPERPEPPPAFRDYEDFCRRMEPLAEAYRRDFERRLPTLERKPLVSVLLPVFDPPEKWLSRAIESVRAQIYPHWELCVADDASTNPAIRELIAHFVREDDRIKAVYRARNGHISAASNSALSLAQGAYVALVDHDDELAPHALARVVDALQAQPHAKLVYTDEDKIDEEGRRSSPHFKSDWNPDLLAGQNCISHLGVYQRALVERIGGFREGFEGAQDWDLALRFGERCLPGQIVHIPEVLYHWRKLGGSTARDIGDKDYAHEAGRRALADHFKRRGRAVSLLPVDRHYWRVKHALPQPAPRAALVIPTRDRLDLLAPCVEAIRERTKYPAYRLVVADNDSREPETLDFLERLEREGALVVRCPGPFNFASINNRAIEAAEADIVCLVNNDVTPINPEWLEELVSQASRLEIGAAGSKLFYPHEHVQHAGVVMGLGGVASEAFKKIHRSDDGHSHRSMLVGNYSAVTGACMAFRKSVWEEAGGFRETDVPNAFGDIDFCLRLGEASYRILFTPFAELCHLENASRGDDLEEGKRDAFEKAVAYMERRWKAVIERDPFYNPNLTLEREDFSYTFPPRGYPASAP